MVVWLATAQRAHDRKVAAVQRQVREWNSGGRKGKLCTGRTAHESMSWRPARYKRFLRGVRLGHLRDILEVRGG